MSKLVKWGRWVVAAFLALQGVLALRIIALTLPRAFAHASKPAPARDFTVVGLCVLFFVCAWGIAKWRRWAHTLTFILLVFEFVVFLETLATAGWAESSARMALEGIFSFGACVWLALPAVRMNLARRQQPA
jgi:hypothetical protein